MMLIGAVAGFAAAAHPMAGARRAGLAGAVAGMLAALIFAILSLVHGRQPGRLWPGTTIFGIGLSAFIGQHYVSFSLPGLPPWTSPACRRSR
jgi:simple sugar transport system permease protein